MSSQELSTLVADVKQAVQSEAESFWVDGVRFWHALWSVRMAILSTFLGGLGAVLPFLQTSIPALPFAILSIVCAAGAGVASLIKQPDLLAAIAADRQTRAQQAAQAAADAEADAQAKQNAMAQLVRGVALQAVQEALANQSPQIVAPIPAANGTASLTDPVQVAIAAVHAAVAQVAAQAVNQPVVAAIPAQPVAPTPTPTSI